MAFKKFCCVFYVLYVIKQFSADSYLYILSKIFNKQEQKKDSLSNIFGGKFLTNIHFQLTC